MLGVSSDCTPPGPSDVENPLVGVALDFISTGPSDKEDPSLGVAVDPSLGLTDGGLLGRGLSSQGSLDVIVVERAVFVDGDR